MPCTCLVDDGVGHPQKMTESSAEISRQLAEDDREVTALPLGFRVVAAVCWRFLVVVGVLVILHQIFFRMYAVIMPVAVAFLLAALLAPVVEWLAGKRVPRTLATALVLVSGLAVVGGVFALVISTVVNGLPGLQSQVGQSSRGIHQWLRQGPLHLSQQQLDSALQNLTDTLRNSQAELTSGALSTAGAVFEFLGGVLLGLFTLLFFLRDGRGIWSFFLRVAVPSGVRSRVDVAGVLAFSSLIAYVRATAAVALMDAVGVGIGAAIVGVALWPVLAALVFLGAFVPYIGALIAGTLAVVTAFVTTGVFPGLIVLAVVVGVMQLEGHVLQPLFLGHAVRLHPLAVVLGIAFGFVVAGVAGAVLAVPVIAVINTAVRSLAADAAQGSEGPSGRTSESEPGDAGGASAE